MSVKIPPFYIDANYTVSRITAAKNELLVLFILKQHFAPHISICNN